MRPNLFQKFCLLLGAAVFCIAAPASAQEKSPSKTVSTSGAKAGSGSASASAAATARRRRRRPRRRRRYYRARRSLNKVKKLHAQYQKALQALNREMKTLGDDIGVKVQARKKCPPKCQERRFKRMLKKMKKLYGDKI